MLGLIHSHKGLEAFLPRPAGFSAIIAEGHMGRISARIYQVSAGATIVAERATLVGIAPL